MRSFRSIVWLIAANFAVVLLLGTVTHLLGLDAWWTRSTGLHAGALLAGAALIGFGGAFVTLLISKPLAKWSTGARVIAPHSEDPLERALLQKVGSLAARAGIPMPEVAIFASDEPNAFATGPSRSRALVAVSTGLVERMDERELEAVLAHEIAHVANGDMLTMTLVQGVLNTFVIALSRVAGSIAEQLVADDEAEEQGPGMVYFATSIACQLVFGLFASAIAAAFSRRRELRADADAAQLVGAPAMIAALLRLHQDDDAAALPSSLASLGLRGGARASWFATHPTIEQRISALRRFPLHGASQLTPSGAA